MPYDMRARLFHWLSAAYAPHVRNDGAELERMYRQAKAAGVITGLDLALPDPHGPSGQADWRGILSRTLPHVDLFLPSLDELAYMLRPGLDVSDLADDTLIPALAGEALAMGAGVVVIKLGNRGLYVRTAAHLPFAPDASWLSRELWAPIFQVNVVGTTGSVTPPSPDF